MATNFNVFVPIFRFLKKERGGNPKYYKLTGSRFDSTIFEAEHRHNKTCWSWRTYVRESSRFLKWRCSDRKAFVKTAGGGGRTHNLKLGKLALCQLSYARVILSFMPSSPCFVKIFFSFLYFGDILRWNGAKNVRAVAIALGFEK